MAKSPCIECAKLTARSHPILGIPLCQTCQRENQERYRYITKSRAIKDYRLKPADLALLGVHKVDNPHYKKAAPMQLYLSTQIEELAKQKWGSSEPYTVALSQFSEELLRWFLEDTNRLMQLTPDKFQYLIADRLEYLGLGIQMVGNVFLKDGGVDIIAYPKGLAVPFLLAVQVKHHRTQRKTNVRDVRDFQGVLTSGNSPFNVGMLVTNTTFTPDAEWFTKNNKTVMKTSRYQRSSTMAQRRLRK